MKTVLITGAGGNLGKAAVAVFARKGWQVAALVSPGKLPSAGVDGVDYYEADLLDEAATSQLVASLWTKYNSIQAALMLVGGFEAGGMDTADTAALRRMLALNVETAYHVARPLFLHMKKQAGGGRLIFVGARPALDPEAGKNLVAYGLSKSQLFTLAGYLNAASSDIKSQVVLFTALDTPENRASMPKADRSRWVTPERVAEAIESAIAEKSGDTRIEVG